MGFCSLEIFFNTLFKQLRLKSAMSIDGPLYMTPTIIFEVRNFNKSRFQLIFKRYLGHCDIYYMINK